MKLNQQQLQQAMQYLRNVAEVDPEDIISNAASQLAYELETVKVPFDVSAMNEKRQELLRYAISKRNTYKLLPGERHAKIIA